MRLIVTGGSGFIGARLVTRLSARGHAVAVVDVVPCAVPGGEMYRRSVLDPAAMREVIRDADAVIHLTGPVRDGLRRDPYGASTLQLQGTLNVLEACRLNGVPRFVLASSFYAYHSLPEDTVADEESTLLPLRMELFGATKLMSEAMCREYTRKYGLTHTILRFGSAYGPGGSNVIRTFLETGLRGEVLVVWGQGKRRNQYTFVDDLADGVTAALHTDNETFNLCSPEITTTARLAEMLTQELGFRVEFDRTRPEEASFPAIDSRKAIDRLRWRPVGLLEGLHRSVREVARSLSVQAPAAP